VPHGPPTAFEVCHYATVLLSGRAVQWKDRERAEDGSDPGEGARGVGCEVGSTEEFGDIDRGRCDRFAPACEDRQLAERIGMPPNEGDKAVGVEDRH